MCKIAFLTEMPFSGKVSDSWGNLRTEFAWMIKANAEHFQISQYRNVSGYDKVFVIIPKGDITVSTIGAELTGVIGPRQLEISRLLQSNFISKLKETNGKVFVIQEGPTWITTDMCVRDQFEWYNCVASCDGILCHNRCDARWYIGLFPHIDVTVIPTMMHVPKFIRDMQWEPEDSVIVGGNFSSWYGGFQSFMVAQELEAPISIPTSHSMRSDENLIDGVTHLPRMMWEEWMIALRKFKYAVHLMPTVAAGTFSANCAWWGIPTIGNELVDTQSTLFPELCVGPYDILSAKRMANDLRSDKGFYQFCSDLAKEKVYLYCTDGMYDDFFAGL